MLGIFNSGTDSDSDIEFSDSLTAQSANYKKMSITSAPKFNHDEDDWAMYKVQLEQFFIANDLEEKTHAKKQKANLIGGLCAVSYKLLENLIQPKLIKDVTTTYENCISALEKHFEPAISEFAERNKFYLANKKEHETVIQWAARVSKKL